MHAKRLAHANSWLDVCFVAPLWFIGFIADASELVSVFCFVLFFGLYPVTEEFISSFSVVIYTPPGEFVASLARVALARF